MESRAWGFAPLSVEITREEALTGNVLAVKRIMDNGHIMWILLRLVQKALAIVTGCRSAICVVNILLRKLNKTEKQSGRHAPSHVV